MSSNASAPTGPGGSGRKDGTPPKDIKESIAALRSILMIDTPTKSLLSGRHPTIEAQQNRYESHKWEELANLRTSTAFLKQKLEEAKKEVERERKKRITLQTAYDALGKHRRDLSVQLELITKSREKVDRKLENLREKVNAERAEMAEERVQWRPRIEKLTSEKDGMEQKLKKISEKYETDAFKLRNLEIEKERLQKSLTETRTELNKISESQSELQPRVDHAERDRKAAEHALAKTQEELNTIKRRHQKSLGSMLKLQQDLKQQLHQAQVNTKEIKQKNEQLLEELQKAEKSKMQFEEKLKSSSAESNSAIQQEIVRQKALRVELQEAKAEIQELGEVEKHYRQLQRQAEQYREESQAEIKELEEQFQEAKAALKEEKIMASNSQMEAESLRDFFERTKQEWPRKLSRKRYHEQVDGAGKGDLPDSFKILDKMIYGDNDSDTDSDPDNAKSTMKLSTTFTEELSHIVQQIKKDFYSLKSKTAEAYASIEDPGDQIQFQLASSREQLREAKDQLMAAKDEADQLREELAELRTQQMAGTKRAYDTSDSDDFGDTPRKRSRGDDEPIDEEV